jgi:hypothetical protein
VGANRLRRYMQHRHLSMAHARTYLRQFAGTRRARVVVHVPFEEDA